jgi:hypothetical protein
MVFDKKMYATDFDQGQSYFDKDWKVFNVGSLRSKLKVAEKQNYGNPVLGITSSFNYHGGWGTFFQIHKENMDILSQNYLHFGAIKVWYVNTKL